VSGAGAASESTKWSLNPVIAVDRWAYVTCSGGRNEVDQLPVALEGLCGVTQSRALLAHAMLWVTERGCRSAEGQLPLIKSAVDLSGPVRDILSPNSHWRVGPSNVEKSTVAQPLPKSLT